METTYNFSSDGSDKNAFLECIAHTENIWTFFKMASGGEVNVVFFMEEVQKYDCLYNKYSKSYKDKYIKINCWTKIGEKVNMSAADAEKKIENVRTGYGRYLKKVKVIPSGSGRDAMNLHPRTLQALSGFKNINATDRLCQIWTQLR